MKEINRYGAHYIYTGQGRKYKKSYIEIEDDRLTIQPYIREIPYLRFLNGILVTIRLSETFTVEDMKKELICNQNKYPEKDVFMLMKEWEEIITQEKPVSICLIECDLEHLKTGRYPKITSLKTII